MAIYLTIVRSGLQNENQIVFGKDVGASFRKNYHTFKKNWFDFIYGTTNPDRIYNEQKIALFSVSGASQKFEAISHMPNQFVAIPFSY